MTRQTILVSGASGILGYGILRSLRLAARDYQLIGTTIYKFSVAPAFSDIVEIAPPTNDKNYMPWLLSLVKEHSVDMIIPGLECDMVRWNEERESIQVAGAHPLLNSGDLITLCSDKWSFYQSLMNVHPEYAIPTCLSDDYNATPAPFLLKPRCGYGSKGIVTISSEAEYDKHRERVGIELMKQEIVGDASEEYTVSAFFSRDSDMLDCIALRRVLSSAGYTQEAEVVMPQSFHPFLKHMAYAFKPVGPTNFQFRIVDDQIKLLEINPRISAATSIRAALGFNEADMSTQYFLNNCIPKAVDRSSNLGRRAIRYVEDYIF